MKSRRKSPAMFRRRGASIAFFVIMLSILIVGLYLAYGLLTRVDYETFLPEDARLRITLIQKGEATAAPDLAPTPVPATSATAIATPLPTPMPTPASTPLPIEYFSLENTKMLMPSDVSAKGEAVIRSIRVSTADASRAVILTGWAFLEGYDAQGSQVYLVVSPKNASTGKRFYAVSCLPGSSGVVHDASRGENLDRADFRAVFDVSTYEEGPYKLGLLVVQTISRKETVNGYFALDDRYQFSVKSGKVTQLEADS